MIRIPIRGSFAVYFWKFRRKILKSYVKIYVFIRFLPAATETMGRSSVVNIILRWNVCTYIRMDKMTLKFPGAITMISFIS